MHDDRYNQVVLNFLFTEDTIGRIHTRMYCNETWLVASWEILISYEEGRVQGGVRSVNELVYQCSVNGTEVDL